MTCANTFAIVHSAESIRGACTLNLDWSDWCNGIKPNEVQCRITVAKPCILQQVLNDNRIDMGGQFSVHGQVTGVLKEAME